MPTTEPLNSALEQQFQAKTEALLRADPQRMACLQAAAELNLPDWALGAGFIRNLIWDHLHHKAVPTPLNDIDLIYLDKTDPQGLAETAHEAWLAKRLPDQQWEVRNQARMHTRQLVAPFASSLEALSHWVEVPTCIGVLQVSANPRCRQDKQIFTQRIKEKRWQAIWPDLQVNWP